jgi:predicted naringenin-chalcone synthase
MQRYAEEALPLAGAAAEQALVNAALPPAAVTHLVTVSCTGFFAPGLDIGLIKRLSLPPTVGRLHVGFMGCHGTLNALRAAQALVDANPAAVVLVCAVELCSLHFQYGSEPDQLVANALFADGAAALVGRSSASGDEAWRVVAAGSYLMPDAEDGMTWRIGNHGFQMTLSPRVPELIGAHLRPWLEAWLVALGRRLEELNSWAVHPGGPRILTSVAQTLGLPPAALAASAEILAECGNMSSPTVLFILQRLQQQGARRPCLALGFGPGLVAEAALLE